MKLETSRLILIKEVLGGYSAHYQDSGKPHIFAEGIEQIIYHGDFSTCISGKNIIVVPMVQNLLEVEYVEQGNKLVISNC